MAATADLRKHKNGYNFVSFTDIALNCGVFVTERTFTPCTL